MSVLYPDLDFTVYPGSLDNISLKSNITNTTDAQLVEQIQASMRFLGYAYTAQIKEKGNFGMKERA